MKSTWFSPIRLDLGEKVPKSDEIDSIPGNAQFDNMSKSYRCLEANASHANATSHQSYNISQNGDAAKDELERSIPASSSSSRRERKLQPPAKGDRVDVYWLLEGQYYLDQVAEGHDASGHAMTYNDEDGEANIFIDVRRMF